MAHVIIKWGCTNQQTNRHGKCKAILGLAGHALRVQPTVKAEN